jgi:hypothetical protein
LSKKEEEKVGRKGEREEGKEVLQEGESERREGDKTMEMEG